MDHHQGLTVRLVEMTMAIEMKVYGKTYVKVLCMVSISRLFYNLLFKIFYFSNANPKMFNVKIMRPFSLPCTSGCSHFQFCSYLSHCACVYFKQQLGTSPLNEIDMSLSGVGKDG